ncbi:MAG: DUF2971 domain-containing protein [Burkholderiales bacterium]|nr:MAG: DUF2971 domain-containing protein [Burkholderiales bacterium]
MADDNLADRVRQILVDHQLFFAAPSSFNDPFDCCPVHDYAATEVQYQAYFLARSNGSRASNANALMRARMLMQRDANALAGANKAFLAARDTLMNGNGTLCLNIDAHHQLMWAHYGDSHRGICIQFDGQHEFFADAEPVHYSSQRPKLNMFTQSDDELFRNSVGTKSDVWAYEQEWRIMSHLHVGNVPFPRAAVSAVILGERATHTTQTLVAQWCSEQADPIPLHKAEFVADSYLIRVPGLLT